MQSTESRSKSLEIPILPDSDAHIELRRGFLATSTFRLQMCWFAAMSLTVAQSVRWPTISAFDGEFNGTYHLFADLLLLRDGVPIHIRITFYVSFSCNRILSRHCAKRFQPVGLKHLPWQPLVIDEQQKQNSIEGREGSQILSATLPLIYMTDIKGTEDHWPPATWQSSKAGHHFIQEQVQLIRANMCFAMARLTVLELAERVSCVCTRVMECKQSRRQDGVFDIRPETGGLSGCRVFFVVFFLCFPTNSTAPAKHTESNPAVRQGFPQMLPLLLLLLLLRWHYVNGHSLQITLMVTWWGVLGSRLTYKHRQIAD